MVENIVGFRFSPTGEELINHYLKNKIIGKTWLVKDAISEINICNHDPMTLPSLAKIQSNDLVWYFFSPKEYKSLNRKVIKRTTGSGYWKATGKDRIIKDKRGNGVEIGIKKTLVYHQGKFPKGVWTPWVIHEYHITCLPHLQRNYVICQVMYKGDDGDILFGRSNSSELGHSLVSDVATSVKEIRTPPEVNQSSEDTFYGLSMNDLILPMNEQEDLSLWDAFDSNTLFKDNNISTNMQLQTPYLAQTDDEFLGGLKHVNRGQVEQLFSDKDQFISRSMQENHSYYMAKKSLSGIIDDSSDAESISAKSYQSSPCDSLGSSNDDSSSYCRDETLSSSTYYSSKDVQTSAKPSIRRKTREVQFTRRKISSKQEVKQGTSRAIDASMKAEKKDLFIVSKTRKNQPYTYLMNMIIGFILLVALISNIISVLASVKR